MRELEDMTQEVAMPSRGYLICCIERTGSNLLAEGLMQTGVAGRPQEYFSPVLQGKPWMRGILGDSTMLTGLAKILRAGSTANGVFGVKLHWAHVRYLSATLSEEGRDIEWSAPGALLKFLSQLPQLLPTAEFLELLRARMGDRSRFTAVHKLLQSELPDLRIIWLRRRNMVARAISHYRALHSKVWHRPVTKAESEAEHAPSLDFDLAQIHQLYCGGLFQEESWQWLFRELAIAPYCVTYEDLVADRESTLRGVLKFLDIDADARGIGPPKLLRQADALSEEWEQRYNRLSVEAGF